MKKPMIGKGNKGLIFAILWLLVENPTDLTYFRVRDILKLLKEEFRKDVDYKTAYGYLQALTEMELDFKIDHIANKGYYVKERIIKEEERNLLINALKSEHALDNKTTIILNDFINIDSEEKVRKNNLKLLKNNDTTNDDYNIIDTIEILKKAIKNKNKISFNYLTFSYKAGIFMRKVHYETKPLEIRYLDGVYYLITEKPIWPKIYCGIKIRYMRDIKILDSVESEVKATPDYNIDLIVLYDWAIEFIDDNFENYRITKKDNNLIAHIEAPYEKIANFCKRFNPFYVVKDNKILERMIYDAYELLDIVRQNDDILLTIKKAIVNFYYYLDIEKEKDYITYMKKFNKYINNLFLDLKYEEIIPNVLSLNDIKVSYEIVTFDSKLLNKTGDIEELIAAKNRLLNKDVTNRYIIFLYDTLTEKEKRRILEIVSYRTMNDLHDRFSLFTKAYYHNFDVFKIF